MVPLVLVLATLVLLIGFYVLVNYEMSRGVRLLSIKRARLDDLVMRAQFIFANVDLFEFAHSELEGLAHRIGHDTIHFALRLVRFVERMLTRIIKWLRTRPVADEAPRATAREFVRTLSDFKDTLEAVHPEIQGVEEIKKETSQ